MTKPSRRHVDTAQLVEMIEGGSRPLDASAHLEACAGCRRDLAALERLLGDMRADRSPEPPDELVARAVDLFPARPSAMRRVVESIARMVEAATSAPAALSVAGVRGDAASSRLRFAGDGVDVDVELVALAGRRQLTAQAMVTDGGEPPTLAWLDQAGRTWSEQPVDETGAIHFESLPEGAFDVVLDLGERRLRLPIPGEAEA